MQISAQHRVLAGTALAVLLLVVDCFAGTEEYYPMHIGNQWHYMVVTQESRDENTSVDTTFFDRKIVGMEQLDEKAYFEITDGGSAFFHRYDASEERLYEYDTVLQKDRPVFNDEDGGRALLFDSPFVRAEIVAVPAGTFDDWIDHSSYSMMSLLWYPNTDIVAITARYFARNVGQVYTYYDRQETRIGYYHNRTTVHTVLIYAKINGAAYEFKATALKNVSWGEIKSLFLKR